jgi:hypothetical protein
MVDFSSWIRENWSSAIGALGIIGSLWMAIASARREAKAREIENLLTLADHHRELWASICERPEINRVLQKDATPVETPVTIAEQETINLVMIQYLTAWRVSKAGGIITTKELASDVRSFFALPLPRAVWEKTKQFRNPKFVRFVERALNLKT